MKHETRHHSAQVAIHKGAVFIAEQKDKDSAAEKDKQSFIDVLSYSRQSEAGVLLFSYTMRSNCSAYISALDEYIACIDKGTKSLRLKLYDRRKKTVQTPQLPRLNHLILNIKFLQDGSLLATRTECGKYYLNKYGTRYPLQKLLIVKLSCLSHGHPGLLMHVE